MPAPNVAVINPSGSSDSKHVNNARYHFLLEFENKGDISGIKYFLTEDPFCEVVSAQKTNLRTFPRELVLVAMGLKNATFFFNEYKCSPCGQAFAPMFVDTC